MARYIDRGRRGRPVGRKGEKLTTTGRKDEAHARRYAAIVVAAGRGVRAGLSDEGPKQYRAIGGVPVIARAVAALAGHRVVETVAVVIHPDDEERCRAALAGLPAMSTVLVHGGETRQASVRAGLRALSGQGITHVLIHDAARPFLPARVIDRIEAAFEAGAEAVVPAVAVADTLKRVDARGIVAETVPRSGLYAAQTPQAFVFDAILAAHDAAASSGSLFTDDAAVAEDAGLAVVLAEGDAGNIKLTLAEDIAMADARFQNVALPDIRTGNGYDVHRLVPGAGVTLCGVFIAHDHALDGHSDADVGLHALTDALLATCGAGDIGDHFPPSDPQWKDAASRRFVEHAAALVRAQGGVIMNADVSLIVEAPRISTHRAAMRAELAGMLAIDETRCSVKATTNEAIGFVGRGEGIAALATASVGYPGKTR